MHPLIESQRTAIEDACRRHGVRRLDAFGSIVRADFDPRSSDIDLLVDLGDLDPVEYKRAFFALKRDLEEMLQRHVDLLTEASLTNPHLRAEINASRAAVYVG